MAIRLFSQPGLCSEPKHRDSQFLRACGIVPADRVAPENSDSKELGNRGRRRLIHAAGIEQELWREDGAEGWVESEHVPKSPASEVAEFIRVPMQDSPLLATICLTCGRALGLSHSRAVLGIVERVHASFWHRQITSP